LSGKLFGPLQYGSEVLREAVMHKRLTITVDERVYRGLHSVIGRRRISRFIESLVRPHVIGKDLRAAFQRMARDEAREAEALDWAEATVGDAADEAR
jgi:hypothetical protein